MQQQAKSSDAIVLKGQLRVVHAAATLTQRRKERKVKKKLTKFERRYSELGPHLKPEQRRIDYVLVYKKKKYDESAKLEKRESLQKKKDMRMRFEKALVVEGFLIKRIEIGQHVFKLLHCPFKRLCKEAERVKLEMPLRGCGKFPPVRTNCLTEFMDKYLETDNEVDYISAPFKMNKIELYEFYDNPTFFFRPSQRSLLTHNILINIDIREVADIDNKVLQKRDTGYSANMMFTDLCLCCPYFLEKRQTSEDYVLQKIGLPYLLMQDVYSDAFVLHEDSELSKLNEESNKDDTSATKDDDNERTEPLVHDPRKVLDETWTWRVWWKFQPVWKIRNYFGEKIALYFAWSGLLIASLWIPVFFGLAVFFFGLTVSVERSENSPEMPTNLTSQQELKWQMTQLFDTLRGSFDNDVTPWFALVICLWGTVFLELWKRHNARLAYEWDVDDYEAREPDRPQFFGTKVKKDPVTDDDNWFYPFKRQMLKFCVSASALIFMVSIVFISLAGVVIYRVIISVDYCTDLSTVECLITTTIVSALLNAVSILLLGKLYDWVALKLTDWENHRTQTNYDDALIIKLFAFQFANSYASCFYIAFFRGRFDTFGMFGLGPEYNDDCDGVSCMAQLSFQVLILMLAKPFPKFLMDIILPFLRRLWRNRPQICRSHCCKNQVQDEEKRDFIVEDSADLKKSKAYLEKEYLKPNSGDFTLSEYTEKVIIYGFLMIFAASFPLAPLIAILCLGIDIRIDAKRLLWFNRRPVAIIAQDIGMWYSILHFVNLVGVISNGFLIAFTSSWGLQYDLTTRLWICLGFEHIVFALKFILAYMIPDVPKDVTLSIRREKFQVAKKLEEKSKPIDYSDLIPQLKSYNDRMHGLEVRQVSREDGTTVTTEKYAVREDSANYQDFSMTDDPGDPIAEAILDIVQEEDEQPESVDDENLMLNMWYSVDGGTRGSVPEIRFAESQGEASLREVDPEGSGLLHKQTSYDKLIPVEENDGPGIKSPAKQNGTKRQFGFMPERSKSMVEQSEIPSFPPGPPKVFVPANSSEELNLEETSKNFKVDPYKVVTQQEIEERRAHSAGASNKHDDDKDVTEC